MQFQHYKWYMRWCKKFWECSQQSACNYATKSLIAPPKDVIEVTNESVYGTHMRILLKMNLRVQMDAKSGKLKVESMSESVNGKTINAFEVRLMIQFRVQLVIYLELHLKANFNIYIYKDAQEGAPYVALKGTFLVPLELHLFMQLSMHKSVQNDSTF